MRARTAACAAIAVIVIVLAVVRICSCRTVLSDLEKDKDAALRRYFQGHVLFDEGRYAEAAEHYWAWKRYEEAQGMDSSEVTGLIGHTLGLAGRDAEAIALLDASLAARKRWSVCVFRAHCIARQEGDESALAWLKGIEIDPVDRLRAIAKFLRDRGRYTEAIPVGEDLLERVEGREYLVNGEVVAIEEMDLTTRSKLATLAAPLRELAECALENGDPNAAEHYATLGIQVGQRLNRGATYLGAKYVEAGDMACRLVRARIRMDQADWDGAEREIEWATAMAKLESSRAVRDLERAMEELSRRRPKR